MLDTSQMIINNIGGLTFFFLKLSIYFKCGMLEMIYILFHN